MAPGPVLPTHPEHGQHSNDDRSEQSQEEVLDPRRHLRRYVVVVNRPPACLSSSAAIKNSSLVHSRWGLGHIHIMSVVATRRMAERGRADTISARDTHQARSGVVGFDAETGADLHECWRVALLGLARCRPLAPKVRS